MDSEKLIVNEILKKIGKPNSVTPRGSTQYEERVKQINEILESGKLEQTEINK